MITSVHLKHFYARNAVKWKHVIRSIFNEAAFPLKLWSNQNANF